MIYNVSSFALTIPPYIVPEPVLARETLACDRTANYYLIARITECNNDEARSLKAAATMLGINESWRDINSCLNIARKTQ